MIHSDRICDNNIPYREICTCPRRYYLIKRVLSDPDYDIGCFNWIVEEVSNGTICSKVLTRVFKTEIESYKAKNPLYAKIISNIDNGIEVSTSIQNKVPYIRAYIALRNYLYK